MEELQFEQILQLPPFDPPPGFGAIYRPGDEIGHRTLPGTPGEGQNAEEPIMIGSSDEEDDDEPVMTGLGIRDERRTLEELRARLLNGRHGTPIPRAREDGLRIMSPPPAVPPLPLHAHFHRRADWPHPHQHPHHHALQDIQQRLASGIRNDVWHRLIGPDRVGRFLGMMFGPNGYGAAAGGAGGPGAREVEEYDTRMTHARAKPRIGFTYDFAPDEEDEDQVKKPTVRTRTTIIIPDSPPTQPVDRKGKGRAIEEVLDLESDEWNQDVGASASTSAGGSASGSTIASPPRKKRKTVEVVEVLSDDDEFEILEEEEEAQAESKVQTVLVCAGCRRPLRMGGDRLWALRCGHMIDSRCYRQLGERPIVPEDIPILLPDSEPEPVATTTTATSTSSRGRKKRRGGGGGGKSRAKGKTTAPVAAPPPAPVPYVAETIEWTCPVFKCGRVHWSERVVTGGTSAWQPMKDTGAVGVFV